MNIEEASSSEIGYQCTLRRDPESWNESEQSVESVLYSTVQ